MTKGPKKTILGAVVQRRTRGRYLAEQGGAGGMRGTGHVAGERRGAGVGMEGGA